MFFSFLTSNLAEAATDNTEPAKRASRTTASLLPVRLETYTDSVHGYAFDYPAGWFAQPNRWQIALTTYVPAVSLYSHDPFDPKTYSQEAPQTSILKIDFISAGEGQPNSIDEFLNEMSREMRGGDYTLEQVETFTLPSGLSAAQALVTTPFGIMMLLFTVVSGRGLRVVGFGDLTLFASVASTLRAA